jgi:hypothetical protein
MIASNDETAVNVSATDLAFIEAPGRLYAAYEGSLFESTDLGCTWNLRAQSLLPATAPTYIATSEDGAVYLHNQETIVRVLSSTGTTHSFPERFSTVAVDPNDSGHLRGIAVYGEAYDSLDSGATWKPLGDATRSIVNVAAFDPANFDHVLVGDLGNGIVATYDGGKTWTQTALSFAIPFEIAFSQADSTVVWVQADTELYRSVDGGRTFSFVLTSTPSLPFTRATLAPHRHELSVVAFRSNAPGVGIFNAATNDSFLVRCGDPRALVWSPADVLYFAAPDLEFVSSHTAH